MDNDNRQCGHEICRCPRAEGSDYCSQHCEYAQDADMTEIRCGCGHSDCA